MWGMMERKERIKTQERNDDLQEKRVIDLKEQMDDFDTLADKVLNALEKLKGSFDMQRAAVEQMLRGR